MVPVDLLLQFWGGASYLSNKILFAFSEGKESEFKHRLRIIGWIIYILGVPAWVIVLVGHNNWIAASIEAGGLPAMFLGLYLAYYRDRTPTRFYSWIVSICTYGSLVFGFGFSLYHHGGINSLSQLLEVGVMVGFLMGSYLLASKNSKGWLFFMLMNLSMASLMFIQDKNILMVQQLISFCFVFYGFYQARAHRVSSNKEAVS